MSQGPENVAEKSKQSWLTRILFSGTKVAPPCPASLDDAPLIPEANANIFSLITFTWITPLLRLGFARPLEATDLWKLQADRGSRHIADKIIASYQRRVLEANEFNERLERGEIGPCIKGIWWSIRGNRREKEKEWKESNKKKASLVWAMNDSVKWWFWSAGLFKVVSDVAQVTSPLVVKAIINFAVESYTSHVMFTSRARSTLTNGKLVNHISTDVSRIDLCAGFFHMSWTALISLFICLALLFVELGPSVLPGFAVFVFLFPIQGMVMRQLSKIRGLGMEWTDKRVKLLQELLGGMKVIKFFAWEMPYLERVAKYRKTETDYMRAVLLIRSGNNAAAFSTSTIASIVAFITYSVTGHPWTPDVIFTSLTLFNLLRLPLIVLPVSLATIADASNAAERLTGVFKAELLSQTYVIDETFENALEVNGVSFTWDAPSPESEDDKENRRGAAPEGGNSDSHSKGPDAEMNEKLVLKDGEGVFQLSDISLTIPRGQLVAIVGAIGSGKSSLLQGLIGEMRKTQGSITFGGSVSYCSQTAWIQNATIRENICFGRPYEEDRYWKAVRDSCLLPDLAVLPSGDLTEVGEKGISLSGGQKQRVSICRTIYCAADIQIFDDPLSALDAHVGKRIFQNVLKENLKGRTRILVTHALHFLGMVDYIYVLGEGMIKEHGTFEELMRDDCQFAKLIKEFGAQENKNNGKEAREEKEKEEDRSKAVEEAGQTMMQAEERNTGAVTWDVYKTYIKAARGEIVIPMVIFSLLLMQGTTTVGSYWLVWWQERWAQALCIFLLGTSIALVTYFSSQALHKNAITRIIHAPMSFFDTTPLGRVTNRFSKDIDNVDNQLGESIRMFLATFATIVGAVILIGIVIPWFLIAVFAIIPIYAYSAAFYRASSRELKRLDSILRSSLYTHFSESLSGLTTIRAYGELDRFRAENEKFVDVENRAYWLTVTNQRWLGIRLDVLGSLLTFVVAMLTVGARFTISPSQTGLVLVYILNIQASMGWMVRQLAEVENNMNSVERILYYSNQVEQEAPYEIPSQEPTLSWPSDGKLELKDVVLSYRPGLPAVLKGVSMNVSPGEKIGIVGRTGAGKSSVVIALFRLVELSSGSIILDGIDLSKVGLANLRKALAIIPQEPLLFSGTLRSNLDPFNLHDDATLWDALKRVYLVDSSPYDSPSMKEAAQEEEVQTARRFTLDTVIEDEGNNLSRSLVSLARALIKNSKVMILDEATASVDYETDHKIQKTIADEFSDRTILCIAHRVRTVISYDRICVLDAGQVAEFDTPANLFQNTEGIFRGMCKRSSITLEDIYAAASRQHP